MDTLRKSTLPRYLIGGPGKEAETKTSNTPALKENVVAEDEISLESEVSNLSSDFEIPTKVNTEQCSKSLDLSIKVPNADDKAMDFSDASSEKNTPLVDLSVLTDASLQPLEKVDSNVGMISYSTSNQGSDFDSGISKDVYSEEENEMNEDPVDSIVEESEFEDVVGPTQELETFLPQHLGDSKEKVASDPQDKESTERDILFKEKSARTWWNSWKGKGSSRFKSSLLKSQKKSVNAKVDWNKLSYKEKINMRKKEARQIKKSKKATEAAEILARARNTQKRLAKNDAMDDKADAMVDKMTSDDVPSRSILFKEKSARSWWNSFKAKDDSKFKSSLLRRSRKKEAKADLVKENLPKTNILFQEEKHSQSVEKIATQQQKKDQDYKAKDSTSDPSNGVSPKKKKVVVNRDPKKPTSDDIYHQKSGGWISMLTARRIAARKIAKKLKARIKEKREQRRHEEQEVKDSSVSEVKPPASTPMRNEKEHVLIAKNENQSSSKVKGKVILNKDPKKPESDDHIVGLDTGGWVSMVTSKRIAKNIKAKAQKKVMERNLDGQHGSSIPEVDEADDNKDTGKKIDENTSTRKNVTFQVDVTEKVNDNNG